MDDLLVHEKPRRGPINLTGAHIPGMSFSGNTELSFSDFSYANSIRVDFSGSTLDTANFANAKLAEANFSNAILTSANFEDSDLANAKFVSACTVGASFKSANLSGSDFTDADCTDANFLFSRLDQTCFERTNLSNATNLNWHDLLSAKVYRSTHVPSYLTVEGLREALASVCPSINWSGSSLEEILIEFENFYQKQEVTGGSNSTSFFQALIYYQVENESDASTELVSDALSVLINDPNTNLDDDSNRDQ